MLENKDNLAIESYDWLLNFFTSINNFEGAGFCH